MPSPFPGFDPYLENPTEWCSFHARFIVALSDAINARLPRPFVARKDVRLYIVSWEKEFYPDVLIAEKPRPSFATRSNRPQEAGTASGVATLVNTDVLTPSLKIQVPESTIQETYIEIRVANRPEEPITVVELLRPTNKNTGQGREAYQSKQRGILQSRVNLVEIDLLRTGDGDVTATPRSVIRQMRSEPFDYLVCLHRGNNVFGFESWPFTVRESLPTIPIPLTGEWSDLVINLQTVFDEVYERELYGNALDYTLSPDPPLSPEDATWSEALLKTVGLREG